MRDIGDLTLGVTAYEFLTDETKTCVGLRFVIRDGYSPTLKSVTIPMDPDAALQVGATLIAHSDWLAGRPEGTGHSSRHKHTSLDRQVPGPNLPGPGTAST